MAPRARLKLDALALRYLETTLEGMGEKQNERTRVVEGKRLGLPG